MSLLHRQPARFPLVSVGSKPRLPVSADMFGGGKVPKRRFDFAERHCFALKRQMDKPVEGGNSGQVLLSFSFSSFFFKCLKPELFLLSLPASTLFEEKTFF